MAICNLVAEMQIPEDLAEKRFDSVIFDAHKAGNLVLKSVSVEFAKLLEKLPTYFTRYFHTDPYLKVVLRDFYSKHDVNPELVEKITYLHTPALPGGRRDVLGMWMKEFERVK